MKRFPLIEVEPWLASGETEKGSEEETGEQDLSGNVDLSLGEVIP